MAGRGLISFFIIGAGLALAQLLFFGDARAARRATSTAPREPEFKGDLPKHPGEAPLLRDLTPAEQLARGLRPL